MLTLYFLFKFLLVYILALPRIPNITPNSILLRIFQPQYPHSVSYIYIFFFRPFVTLLKGSFNPGGNGNATYHKFTPSLPFLYFRTHVLINLCSRAPDSLLRSLPVSAPFAVAAVVTRAPFYRRSPFNPANRR